MQTQSSNFKLDGGEMTPVETVQNWLVKQLAEQLSLDPTTIQTSEPLTRYGLDSIDAVTLVGELEDWLELELPDTLFWDYATIEKASQYLAEEFDLASALGDREVEKSETVKEATPEPVGNANKGWSLFGRRG